MSEMMGYQEKGTFFHGGLHTLTKMVVFLTVTILAGLWLDARYLAPLLLLGLAFNYVAKTPKKWFLVMLTALALTMLPTLRSTVGQADPEYYKVLDPVWAATNVATINTRILGLGTLGFTYGSLMWPFTAFRYCGYLGIVVYLDHAHVRYCQYTLCLESPATDRFRAADDLPFYPLHGNGDEPDPGCTEAARMESAHLEYCEIIPPLDPPGKPHHSQGCNGC
jgi:hypothetical protein